jgi:hypothetical protein
VVSEVFASLLERRTELLPASAEGYLIVAVRNRCLKRLRDKSTRERILHLYATEPQPDDSWQDDEQRLCRLRKLKPTRCSRPTICASSPCASSTARTTRPSAPRPARAASPCGNICRTSSKC